MKSNKLNKSKRKQRAGVRKRKKQLSKVIDESAALNRIIQQFDRGAPEKVVPELKLMTEAEKRIYERSN